MQEIVNLSTAQQQSAIEVRSFVPANWSIIKIQQTNGSKGYKENKKR